MNIREIYTDYMEEILRDEKCSDIVYLFERQLLDEMLKRTENARKAGLNDDKVLTELVISQYPDVKSEYREFYIEEKKKRKEKAVFRVLSWGSLVLLVFMLLSYFATSFITQRWEMTWLIIIYCVTLFVDCVVGVAANKLISMKQRFYNIPARVISGLGVMMTTTCVYLTFLVFFRFENYWIIYPAGVFLIYVVDAIIAQRTKQRMRVFNFLIYVPAAMPMLYVVLGGLHVIPWSPGWLLMPLSVLIDLLIIICIYLNHRRYVYKPEKDEA